MSRYSSSDRRRRVSRGTAEPEGDGDSDTNSNSMEKKPNKPPKPLKILANLFKRSSSSPGGSSSSSRQASMEERTNGANMNHREKTDNGNFARQYLIVVVFFREKASR